MKSYSSSPLFSLKLFAQTVVILYILRKSGRAREREGDSTEASLMPVPYQETGGVPSTRSSDPLGPSDTICKFKLLMTRRVHLYTRTLSLHSPLEQCNLSACQIHFLTAFSSSLVPNLSSRCCCSSFSSSFFFVLLFTTDRE